MDTPSRSQRTGDRGRPGKFRPLPSALCAVKTPEPRRSRSTRRESETTLRALRPLWVEGFLGPWLFFPALGPGVFNFLQTRPPTRLGPPFLAGLGPPAP